MNFSRAKTILIIIFIFVNLFLIVVNNLFYNNENTVDAKTTLKILENNGITAKDGVLKNYASELPGVEIDNLATDEEKLALMLLGKNYNKPRDHYYTTDGETLAVSELSIDFKVINPKEKSYKDVNILNAGNKALKTITKKGLGKSYLEVSNVSDSGNNHYFITLSYNFEGHPVFNNNIYATVCNKGLQTIKGTVVSFKNLKKTIYNITPASNILLELPSNSDLKNEFKNPQITNIRLGYYLPLGKTEASIYAIPAYEIEISNKKVYYYDARENINSEVVLLGSRNIMK